MSYLTLSTDDVLKNTNNDTSFPKLTIVFKEHFKMQLQESYFLKCLNFRVCQSPVVFSINQTDHIMELVN